MPTLWQSGEVGMSDTQVLLNRIAALRQRLEEAREQTTSDRRKPDLDRSPLMTLQRQVVRGAEHNALLDAALRQLPDTALPGELQVLPTRLTVRARRILEQGRELLGRLRTVGERIEVTATSSFESIDDPLVRMYRDTAAMTNTTLRMVQAFPDAASVQLRLAEGLDAILAVIAQRLATLQVLAEQRSRETEPIARLAELLGALAEGKNPNLDAFVTLAESILVSAQQAALLRLVHADPRQLARFVACHSLNVARVVARLVRHDVELRSRPLEPVLAALVHDVGMLQVPAEVLAKAGPLSDEERRILERHCRIGADLVRKQFPDCSWLAEVMMGHHERLDGTGYPGGWREQQLPTLTRLLTVCDIYVALCSPRPHRPAHPTRAALTDTLLLAEQGALDRTQAEHLLQLSFYPPGTAVELAEGAVAVVLATHPTDRDLNIPARPVLAVLTDRKGRALAVPRYLDLAQSEGHSIVRTLSSEERRQLLGGRYPEFV